MDYNKYEPVLTKWKYIGRDVEINDSHLSVFRNPEKIHLSDGVRLDPFIKLEGGQDLYIGKYVHVASFCHLNAGGGKLIIENYAGFATHVQILSGQPDLTNDLHICPNDPYRTYPPIRFTTTVGKYVFVGANVVILGGVTIGEGAIIGAGSIVTCNIPEYTMWCGNPARYIYDRKRIND